nr:MAG TPA: hypothetical protein [Caudoviricetes sp.]
MKNTVGLAAGLIRRAAFVDANALLKDECGVECRGPSQVWYYGLFKGSKAINEALKHVAGMLGCVSCIRYQGSASGLVVVGEEMGSRRVWRMALKTYTTTLSEWVSKASIKSREEFGGWSGGCIFGFFEGLTARHLYAYPGFDGLKKEFLSKDYMAVDACDLHW